QFGHLAPERMVGHFYVDDIDRDVRFTADAQRFGDGFENADAFGAHVRGVEAAEFGGGFAHGDEGIGIDPGAGWPAERTGDAERALTHCLAYEVLHFGEFGRAGRAGVRAVDVGPDLAGADVGADVGGNAVLV